MQLPKFKQGFDEFSELVVRQGSWIKPSEFNRVFFRAFGAFPLREWLRALERQNKVELKQEHMGAHWFFRGTDPDVAGKCQKAQMIEALVNWPFRNFDG